MNKSFSKMYYSTNLKPRKIKKCIKICKNKKLYKYISDSPPFHVEESEAKASQ